MRATVEIQAVKVKITHFVKEQSTGLKVEEEGQGTAAWGVTAEAGPLKLPPSCHPALFL